MFQKLSNFAGGLNRLPVIMAGFGLIVMTGLVTADVIMRRVLNAPLIFADEVAGYLMVLVTFLGLGFTQKEEGHIQVSFLIQRIPLKYQTYFRLIGFFIGIFYVVILIIMTWQLTWESYEMKSFAPTPSQLPLFPFQFVMPVGLLFLLPYLIIGVKDSIFNIFQKKERTDAP